MPALCWSERWSRLRDLTNSSSSINEDVDSVALAVHAAALRRDPGILPIKFGNNDLERMYSLEKGQFGSLEAVRCRLDNQLYAVKRISKANAERFKDYCFVLTERQILRRASTTGTPWVPHLVAAFVTPSYVHMLMTYAEGGSLWNLMESVESNVLSEQDLQWWGSQAVEAIDWCHSQGFAHRDIKPHNFVITANARLQLVDFGSAAPLQQTGTRRTIPLPYCVVLCGTCDYLSPEVLQAHEDALFRAEIDGRLDASMSQAGYGCDTDWWSLGVVLYEAAVGQAPFFANDVKRTYLLIMSHQEDSLPFPPASDLSTSFQDLLKKLLRKSSDRLGHESTDAIRSHSFFETVPWGSLHERALPEDLVLCEGLNANTPLILSDSILDDTKTAPFDFSQMFQSTPGSTAYAASRNIGASSRSLRDDPYEGFPWGPVQSAFEDVQTMEQSLSFRGEGLMQPRSSLERSLSMNKSSEAPNTQQVVDRNFVTPRRPALIHPHTTIPRLREGNSHRKTRRISEREALNQMMECVSATARKKVLQSGKKPRYSFPLEKIAKIPSLQLNFQARHLHASSEGSASLCESAPPSPSPRPGSSVSRRGGSISPFPRSHGNQSDATRTTSTVVELLVPPSAPSLRSAASFQSLKSAQHSQPRLRRIKSNINEVKSADQRRRRVTIDELETSYSQLMSKLNSMEVKLQDLTNIAYRTG